MKAKNKIQKVILLGLVAITLFLIAFSIDTPKPVYAEAKYPCYGYVCLDLMSDPRVIACLAIEAGNAWSCTNYCYSGQWFCAGYAQCQVGC